MVTGLVVASISDFAPSFLFFFFCFNCSMLSIFLNAKTFPWIKLQSLVVRFVYNQRFFFALFFVCFVFAIFSPNMNVAHMA